MVLTRIAATNFVSICELNCSSETWRLSLNGSISSMSGISILKGLEGRRGGWKISLSSGQERWEGSCGDKVEISALDLKKISHELMRGKAAEKGRMVSFIQLLLWVQLCHRQKLYSSLVREMQEYIDVMQWFIKEGSDLARLKMTWYTYWLFTGLNSSRRPSHWVMRFRADCFAF